MASSRSWQLPSSPHCRPSPSSPLVAPNLRRPCRQIKLARAGPDHRHPSSSSIACQTQPALHRPHPHLDLARAEPEYRHPPDVHRGPVRMRRISVACGDWPCKCARERGERDEEWSVAAAVGVKEARFYQVTGWL